MPNGTTATYSYNDRRYVVNGYRDAMNFLDSITYTGPHGTIYKGQYTYDNLGNVLTATDGSSTEQITYGYDWLDRLKSEVRTGAHPYSYAYAYDQFDNRTQKTVNGQGTTYFNYDDSNHLA